jgi:(E)-4-hydroxy-3-methylbut-2-enyl-diphosphate synthase
VVGNFGGSHNVPRVIADLSKREKISHASFFSLGYHYSVPLDKWNIADTACDYIYIGEHKTDFEIPGTLGLLQDYKTWLTQNQPRVYPLLTEQEYLDKNNKLSTEFNFVVISAEKYSNTLVDKIKQDEKVVVIIETENEHAMPAIRRVMAEMVNDKVNVPVVIKRSFKNISEDQFQLYAATDVGGLLIDGLGDGLFLTSESLSDKIINQTAFNILQATRTRISKTEYISCPSCGRTLFDLQETTNKIRLRTNHLKGLKIGIMGCIVNGPGEMADADYGYVGSGPGRITLYKGKEVVRRNIPTEKAVDELVDLIREHGDWVEQENA